jgi:hypothetical protein
MCRSMLKDRDLNRLFPARPFLIATLSDRIPSNLLKTQGEALV